MSRYHLQGLSDGRGAGHRVAATIAAACLGAVVLSSLPACNADPINEDDQPMADPDTIALPAPATDGSMTVEAALSERRSVRKFDSSPLRLDEASQLLWAVQGVTDSRGYRTAPSAGALYPLEVLLVAGDVSDLEPGVYRYDPQQHALRKVASGDLRTELRQVSLDQEVVADASLVIVLAAVYERTSAKYGERARRYVHMEVGAAAENAYLQAEALGLGTVFIGAFDDDQVSGLLGLPRDEHPLCLLPVGRPESADGD